MGLKGFSCEFYTCLADMLYGKPRTMVYCYTTSLAHNFVFPIYWTQLARGPMEMAQTGLEVPCDAPTDPPLPWKKGSDHSMVYYAPCSFKTFEPEEPHVPLFLECLECNL